MFYSEESNEIKKKMRQCIKPVSFTQVYMVARGPAWLSGMVYDL